MQMATVNADGGAAPVQASLLEADWDSVGGHAALVQQLKEMVMLPLLYPELLQQLHITAPR